MNGDGDHVIRSTLAEIPNQRLLDWLVMECVNRGQRGIEKLTKEDDEYFERLRGEVRRRLDSARRG